MARRRRQVQLGSTVGGLVGAAAGWATAAAGLPALEVPLASGGFFIGGTIADRIHSSSFWQRLTKKKKVESIIKRKARFDLENSCLISHSSVTSALSDSASSFAESRAVNKSALTLAAPELLYSLDYTRQGSIKDHASNLAAVGTVFRVNCPPLFTGGLAALHTLQDLLKEFSIQLEIDDGAATSKEQVHRLASAGDADFALIAESAYYLAPTQLALPSIYFRALPCFHQEDCLLSLTDDTHARMAVKTLYHESSTAEIALRASTHWGRIHNRKPFATASEIATLVSSLESGMYVTSWQPITTVLTEAYSDVVVVPGSRFKGFISLFARMEWTCPKRRKAFAAFVSLFIREFHRLRNARLPMSRIAQPHIIDGMDNLCGISSLT